MKVHPMVSSLRSWIPMSRAVVSSGSLCSVKVICPFDVLNCRVWCSVKTHFDVRVWGGGGLGGGIGSTKVYLQLSHSTVFIAPISVAGYSVITYLLGVGDRHLDNLLLSESGHLIHVDFGYILGRDPKVFPPPMKLNKEMVEGMGGTSSIEYQRFREHCYNAFLALRRYMHVGHAARMCT